MQGGDKPLVGGPGRSAQDYAHGTDCRRAGLRPARRPAKFRWMGDDGPQFGPGLAQRRHIWPWATQGSIPFKGVADASRRASHTASARSNNWWPWLRSSSTSTRATTWRSSAASTTRTRRPDWPPCARGRAMGPPSCARACYSVLLRALLAGQGRHRGVAVVEPAVSDHELAQLLAAGVRGVRFNLVSPAGHAGDAAPALLRLAPLNCFDELGRRVIQGACLWTRRRAFYWHTRRLVHRCEAPVG